MPDHRRLSERHRRTTVNHRSAATGATSALFPLTATLSNTMVRCRRTSNTESIPSTYYLQGKTVVDIVSKQCDHLSHQLQLIDQLIETKKRTYFDKAELELVHSRPRIQNQIKVLNKLKKRFNSEPTDRALNIVTQLLLDLDENLALISEAEENLGLGKSLLESQHNALCCKSKVVHRIDILERIFKEISMAQLPFFRAKLDRDIARYEWPPLLLHLREFKGFAEIYENCKLVQFEVPLLSELRKMRGIIFFYLFNIMMTMTSHEGESLDKTSGEWAIEWTVESPVEESMSDSLQECEEEAKCSVTLKEDSAENCKTESTDKGCNAIRNLNFSLSMNDSEIREVNKSGRRGISEILPGVESIRVCKEVIIPKFRANKHVYVLRESMVMDCKIALDKQLYLCINTGYEVFWLDLKQSKDHSFNNAQDVPFIPRIATMDLEEQNLPILSGLFKWKSNAFMIGGTYKESKEAALKGHCRRPAKPQYPSCLTYTLSVAADDHTVSYAKSCYFMPNKPSLWPIVEEINGKIHVIQSAPNGLECDRRHGLSISHEVFNPDSPIAEIPTFSDKGSSYDLRCCSVLGDCIYAYTGRGPNLVFDTSKWKWKAHPKGAYNRVPKDIWSLLGGGPVKCVGTFPHGLYVVLSIQPPERTHLDGTYAVACLVNSTGRIICTQRLHDFFKGPVWPSNMVHATIIQADDEGKTMCSIVNGGTWDEDCDSSFLFINIFQVELLASASVIIKKELAKGSEVGPIELEFVHVHTKHSYIYKTDEELGWGHHPNYWAGLQACFIL